MERKEIQEQRVRNYFIEAAKNLLKGEGLKSVNVRSVAEQAGYSYATLYNYFKDLNELIFICVKDFQDETEIIIGQKIKDRNLGAERIKAITKEYASYFVEYPGVFELFFIERMGSMNNRTNITGLIYDFLDRLCDEDWNYCREQGIFTQDQIEIKKDQLKYSVTGILLFYLHRLQPEDYHEFVKISDRQLDDILKISEL